MISPAQQARDCLARLGVAPLRGDALHARSPIDGQPIGGLECASAAEVDAAIARAQAAFLVWRSVPAPRRGELVRRLGEALRGAKVQLGLLVTLETGKIASEGLGEVQEMIDICDFAVGLSRQLAGLTLPSERPGHHMLERWQPLGPVAIVSAFNFPVAVWSWNAALALVCGNPLLWKPSEKAPLTALAVQALFARVAADFPEAPPHLSQLLLGGREVSGALAAHPLVSLVSATGSTAMGRALGPVIAARFGRALLELGGNNAMIVAPSADLEMAVRAILFAAVGTAGQRCTTLRRLIVHESVAAALLERLAKAYGGLRIGDPRLEHTLVGPLIDRAAGEAFTRAVATAVAEGGDVRAGGGPVETGLGGAFVAPALLEMPAQSPIVRHETFAPILYTLRYRDFDEALALQNGVEQGLSSSVFTTDMREAERFLSAAGSDCGIANINIGTSGAEIGGAFGGEKATGGGRESGSDSWKAYMRRQTQTVNYSSDLPLAQGVVFG